MKKINVLKLKNVLEIAKHGLTNKGNTFEQSDCFVFKGKKIISYNDNVCYQIPFDDLDINGAIEWKYFYPFVKSINKPEITVRHPPYRLILQEGQNSKAMFPIDPEIKLPLNEVKLRGESWEVIPPNFLKALEMASYFTDIDYSSNLNLFCIFINENGFIEASDGLEIFRYNFPDQFNFPSFLIDFSDGMKNIIKLNPTEIMVDEAWVHFRNEDGIIASIRLKTENKDHNFDEFLYKEGKMVKIELPNELQSVIKQAKIFCKNEITQYEQIKITIFNDNLTLKSISENGTKLIKKLRLTKSYPKKIIWLINPNFFDKSYKLFSFNEIEFIEDKFLRIWKDDFIYLTVVQNEE